MTDGELAAFLGAFDEPSEAEWKENYEEAYWRSARNSFEYVRLLRLIHPTARQLVMTADEAVDFYRRITHGPRTEAQRQADFKILSREQRGPKSGSRRKKVHPGGYEAARRGRTWRGSPNGAKQLEPAEEARRKINLPDS
jgi:hypothetical protein